MIKKYKTKSIKIKNLPKKWLLVLPIFAFLAIKGINFIQGNKYILVTEVTDGDTIKLVDNRRIRYLNIDAPEKDECYALKAKEINEKLVLNKKVRLELDKNEMDRFGRTLAYVYVAKNGQEMMINQSLLEKGAAIYQLDTVNLKHAEILTTTANQAHDQKKGLWQECASNPKEGCLIKGNYDDQGHRWYHLPHFRHYSQVIINLEDGDQWFCTEEEAIKTGFKKARE